MRRHTNFNRVALLSIPYTVIRAYRLLHAHDFFCVLSSAIDDFYTTGQICFLWCSESQRERCFDTPLGFQLLKF